MHRRPRLAPKEEGPAAPGTGAAEQPPPAFARQAGLHSIPRHWGVANALWVARVFHLIMLVLLAALIVAFGLGKFALAGMGAVVLLLGYEHSLVSKDDLGKLNAAFFTMNGIIAVVFFVFLALDLLTRRSGAM